MRFLDLCSKPATHFSFACAALAATTTFIGCAQAQAPAELPTPLTNVARQSEPGAPFINTWLLLGTFDNDAQNTGFNRAFIDETNVSPQDGQAVGAQTWRYFDDRLFSRNYDNYNDLFSYFDIKQNASVAAKVVYAHSYVYSPTAQNVQLRVGADTGFKAWVNGALVGGSTLAGPTKRLEGENQVLIGGRDFVVVPASLNAGWNRLLLKISNTENGRFGFYARFTTNEGYEPRGLEYSVNGGEGALTIENRAMPEAKTGALPLAWREWPYVKAEPDIDQIIALGTGAKGAGGQKPPAIPRLVSMPMRYNRGTGMSASAFKLSSRGGQLPLVWTKAKGALPLGMTVQSDGTLGGTPSAEARLGDYVFTAQVRDAAGKTATREYSLTLRERPNRVTETGRLIGLIHGMQDIAPADVAKVAGQMKRQGYTLGIPTLYNNGTPTFHWPTKFSKRIGPYNVAAASKKAFEAEGIGFGIYTGPFDGSNETEFTLNQQGLVMKEALIGYPPKALWFDWLGGDSSSLDSLFSIVRSIDPEIVILMNGSDRMSQGDWDIMNFEGWSAWGGGMRSWNTWPAHFPYPKKFTPSSWRFSTEKEWSLGNGGATDWREMLRIQLSLIGEGFIADIDHSPTVVGMGKDTFDTKALVIQHEKMANWTTRPNLPPLHEAFTHVDPGPLKAAAYGYNTINLKHDAIYLLALQNMHGKIGLPLNTKLNVGAVPGAVASVRLMNTGAPLEFTHNVGTGVLSIDTQNVAPDEVGHIIKIALKNPLSPAQAKAPPMISLAFGPPLPTSPVPAGNIATSKPAWLLSADGTRELSTSAFQFAIYGVDGRPETSAVAADEYAWSYKVDLQKTATIRRITPVFAKEWFASHYRILVSQDDKTWTRVVEVADAVIGGEKIFNIVPTQARFVRVQALKPDGPGQPGGQMSIIELQVSETAKAGVAITPMPARLNNLATDKPAKFLSADGTRDLGPSTNSIAANGVDGYPATIAMAGGEYAWTYHVDLKKSALLRRIDITFAPGHWATEYNVFVSRDGQEWKAVAEVKDNGFAGAKSHSFEPTTARYVRVQALKPDGPGQPGTQMGIAELQVFDK